MALDAMILAIKDKKKQDVEIMRALSMNLWRRINAGYNLPMRQPEGQTHSDFKHHPELEDKVDREYFHKRSDFTEYAEACARFAQLIAKPKKEVPPYTPHKIRMEMAAKEKAKADRAAQKEAALRKVGALPQKSASPPKGVTKKD